MNTELLQLGALRVVRRMRRGNEQTEHQRGDSGDQAHHELYQILGIALYMMCRQSIAYCYTQERGAKGACNRHQSNHSVAHIHRSPYCSAPARGGAMSDSRLE